MKLNTTWLKFSRLFIFGGLLLIAQPAVATDRLTDDQLLTNGRNALAKLPANVMSADAELFADAFRYLLAYQQRRPMRMKQDPAHAAEVNQAVAWFSKELKRVAGGGTRGTSDDLALQSLKREGLANYGKLPKNDRDISNRHAAEFIVAIANLYAFDQHSRNDDAVHKAVLRLENTKASLRAASSTGNPDEPRPKWAPATRKPAIADPSGARPKPPGAAISDPKPRQNEIRQFRATRTSLQTLNVTFDYRYLGDHGTDVYLNAFALGSERRLTEMADVAAIWWWVRAGRPSQSRNLQVLEPKPFRSKCA
jgi:hypothetical protein